MKSIALTPCPSPEYGRGESGNPHLAARRAAKAALLPRAAALAGEGRSYQEIAAALGVAKSTVCNWLRDRPLGRAAVRSLGTPRMTARLAARYESMYHRAVREWNRSRTDRRTESVVTITPADGSPTIKTTVRTEPRIGNAACLGKALAATQALEGLHRRERTRQERLEDAASDAAAGKVTRTVKTTLTPSGRKVQTVVTTRSDDGGLAALRDAQEALNGAADTGSARSVNVGAAGMPGDRRKSFQPNALPLSGCDFAAVRRSATLPNEVLQKRGAGASNAEGQHLAHASGFDAQPLAGASRSDAHSLASASGSDNAPGADVPPLADASGYHGAGSVNGVPAKKRRDWRKSFVPKDLRLGLDELDSVPRSATLPNEVLQERGHGKVGGKSSDVRGRRSEVRGQGSGPRVGTADSLARELDRVLGGKGILPAAIGDAFR